MDVVKKIPPSWIAVAVLVVIVFVLMFRQSRSGYTPTTGAPITLMDLQEYSAFSPAQKQNYVNKLTAYQPRLSNAVSTNSFTTYKMLLDEVMINSMPGPTPPMKSKCSRGQFSQTGYQPGCMPCPKNTFCPNEGTSKPAPCPTEKSSPAGSTSNTMCTGSLCRHTCFFCRSDDPWFKRTDDMTKDVNV
jgi:hypothetical protein